METSNKTVNKKPASVRLMNWIVFLFIFGIVGSWIYITFIKSANSNPTYSQSREALTNMSSSFSETELMQNQVLDPKQSYKDSIQKTNQQLVNAMQSLKSAVSNWQKAYGEDGNNAMLSFNDSLAYSNDLDSARRQFKDAETTFNTIGMVPDGIDNLNEKWKINLQEFMTFPDLLDNVVTTFADGQTQRAIQMGAALNEKMLQLFSDTTTLSQQIQDF